MAHTVSGKLHKEPFIKHGCGPQQDSTMYIVELSEMIKSYNSDEKSYTNYSATFFAKSQAANDLYSKVFASGSFIVVSCDKLKTDIQAGSDGRTFVKLRMENARLDGFLAASDSGAPQQGGYQQPQQPQQPQQRQAPQQQSARPQYNEPPMDFDDDIPFAPVGLQFSKLPHCI